MARPATVLEKLSQKLREEAFFELAKEYLYLNGLVSFIAKRRNVELDYAERAVIVGHLIEDIEEMGKYSDPTVHEVDETTPKSDEAKLPLFKG